MNAQGSYVLENDGGFSQMCILHLKNLKEEKNQGFEIFLC